MYITCDWIEVNGNGITICLRSKPERDKPNKDMIERLVAILNYRKIKYVLFQVDFHGEASEHNPLNRYETTQLICHL